MPQLIQEYSETNTNNFSEKLLNIRSNDFILDYLKDISKALEAIEGIKFLSGEIETDESKFPRKEAPQKKNTKGNRRKNIEKEKTYIRNIKDSRLNLVTLKFSIEGIDGYRRPQSEILEIKLYVPKLINNSYFYLNGNNYYAVYQLVDSSTYNNRDTVTLKSLLMPIIIKRYSYKITDTAGYEWSSYIYNTHLFKNKTNIFYYFFAYMGVKESLKYFDVDKDITFVKGKESIKKPGAVYFKLGSKTEDVYLAARESKFKSKGSNGNYFRSIVACLVNICDRKTISISNIIDKENIYWRHQLGAIFAPTNISSQLEKCDTVLTSFKRILDECTKRSLRIDPEDKEDIFAIIRWIVRNFSKLLKKDNFSLLNKRIRLSEYICTDFSKKLSKSTYRLLNKKSVTFSQKKSIFTNISTNMIVKFIISSLELIRYNNSVNVMDLFTTKLKYSSKGPQSQSEGGGKSVSVYYRWIYPSHIGRLDINSCSNGDPGLSGHFSPFVDLKDNFYFIPNDEIDNEE